MRNFLRKRKDRSSLTFGDWEDGKSAALELLRAELAGSNGDFEALDRFGILLGKMNRASLESSVYTIIGWSSVLLQEAARLNEMTPSEYFSILEPFMNLEQDDEGDASPLVDA
ncbi:hypothetical protein [Aeromicrobium sp. 179-A 4D2 NHS]|uniref:hypothetical protein n=1 Tax=Aeromicrobium sp. 179-A 4D2 NHS TaxID=3142375 RepID=UPI0039A1FC65